MAWLAVDSDGTEKKFKRYPHRVRWLKKDPNGWWGDMEVVNTNDGAWILQDTAEKLPIGTIATLIGKNLSWENEPYEYNNLL